MCSENEEASDRNRAMASALATFLRQVGFQAPKNNNLERCQSFVTKDKKMWKFAKSNKKVRHECGCIEMMVLPSLAVGLQTLHRKQI